MPAAALLDVDGTLVDTNYHHALAWYRAFRQHEIVLPVWGIHRHIGMGGDHMVAALAGDDAEKEHGDDIRAAEKALYLAVIEEVEPLEGARELMVELKRRGHPVVLASSAKQNELDHYLDLLDAREVADGWTSSADVESTKPDPDIVTAAMEKAGSAAQGGRGRGLPLRGRAARAPRRDAPGRRGRFRLAAPTRRGDRGAAKPPWAFAGGGHGYRQRSCPSRPLPQWTRSTSDLPASPRRLPPPGGRSSAWTISRSPSARTRR